MNLLSVSEIKNILSKYDTAPSKRMGQNFLIDKNVLQKIIKTANLKPDDIVLEVGPGIGTLTQELAKTANKVIAIEKDKTMCEILKETLKGFKNAEVIYGDVLKSQIPMTNVQPNPKSQIPKKYKVVANIPYYLTSPLIRKLLESKNPPQEIILMVQKEVAQRICANPPKMSLFAVSVQFYAKPEIISNVSKNCFWPSPKVDSAIIKIVPTLREMFSRLRENISREVFFRVIKAGFSQPRKQLVNNLTTLKSVNGVKLTKEQISSWLLKNNLKPKQRAETLNVKDWVHLARDYQNLI